MGNICAVVISAILSGLLGVVVTLCVQKKALKRAEKKAIFKTLMENRFIYGPSYEKTRALNAIDVTFYDSKEVLVAWGALYEYYSESMDNFEPTKSQDRMIKLLQTMAHDLGYKKLDWTTIKNPYIPVGINTHLNNSAEYQNLQLELMSRGVKILRQWMD